MHNLGVASTCCPDDGIHAVLLRERAKIKSAVRLSGTILNLRKFAYGLKISELDFEAVAFIRSANYDKACPEALLKQLMWQLLSEIWFKTFS